MNPTLNKHHHHHHSSTHDFCVEFDKHTCSLFKINTFRKFSPKVFFTVLQQGKQFQSVLENILL